MCLREKVRREEKLSLCTTERQIVSIGHTINDDKQNSGFLVLFLVSIIPFYTFHFQKLNKISKMIFNSALKENLSIFIPPEGLTYVSDLMICSPSKQAGTKALLKYLSENTHKVNLSKFCNSCPVCVTNNPGPGIKTPGTTDNPDKS